jgi:hypothetical protein
MGVALLAAISPKVLEQELEGAVTNVRDSVG